MAKKPTKQEQIEMLQRQLAERNREIHSLEGQLKEARRRSIPIGNGQDLNFLPIAITKYEFKRDVVEVNSVDGTTNGFVGAPITATIIAEGLLLTR